MIREADIDGDGQVNYEGEFLSEIMSVNMYLYLSLFFRIRHHDDLQVICYNVLLWTTLAPGGSGGIVKSFFIDFTNTQFFSVVFSQYCNFKAKIHRTHLWAGLVL